MKFRKFRPIQQTAAGLALFATLVTAFTCGLGLVVCTEADGCVAVEIVAAGAVECSGCIDEHDGDAAAQRPASAERGAQLDGCPCVDVAVSLEPGVVRTGALRSKSVPTPAPADLSAFSCPLPMVPRPPRDGSARIRLRILPPPMLARSVVLLI